ncbi:hypothetical protein [Leptolyngbya sp. 7M]|uniref:hypothetical protein n=1 Tax=Leptolyngbya sp. 7M TaxID=2812896 RepID=UPI001B8C08A1|nr:hypothetical protein [Leptolyngbya sp. 7M]QYO66833.1 hypothetical protein JVX88_08525 [Leptolyngbya sp. 7M]
MDILNSGSFVPLDNKERMEQLAFTAKTLAIEVSRAEGFQSSGPTNHQLGLEMWKGAEYVCRAHEEATIRNLFLSKFLETLREIERQNVGQRKPSQTEFANVPTVHSADPVQPQIEEPSITRPDPVPFKAQPSPPPEIQERQPKEARDEFLGVIPQEDALDTERPSYADECKPECEADIVAMTNDKEMAEIDAEQADELREAESIPPMTAEGRVPKEVQQPAATESGSNDASKVERSGSPDEPIAPRAEDTDIAGSPVPDAAPAIGSIVLSDREPFDFKACTVTAVIQLLPEEQGVRKCVVSVRSHDFAPQISISALSNDGLNDGLRDCLETAIGQYATHLPELAAEKVKKQKAAIKKRTSKTDAKSSKSSPGSKSEAAAATTPPATESAETAKDQQGLFAS